MINELVNQSKLIASESNTRLLDDTLKFEYEIDKLIDKTKLEELKGRFNRHIRKERIIKSLVELSTFVGSVLPAIILKPISLLKKIWNNYFSSKKTSAKAAGVGCVVVGQMVPSVNLR